MSYAIYTTKAIVCGSKDSKTADRSYLLFTKDAGMIYATARSVREERSKQRHSLQDFAQIKVSLVQGKSGWRIGSVEQYKNPYYEASERVNRITVVRIVRTLRRFIHGGDENMLVFQDAWQVLKSATEIKTTELDKLYTIFTARLLHQLGYLPITPAIQEAFVVDFNEAIKNADDKLCESLAGHIKIAENSSHL
ncbi:recombination protein O N-terminal domain-containing protein [Candidatus Kaiserbacteria bacterium]|nr:recombination protein O N-terminal domain-containing protein [Candidatus Kaiserbacteria bacterium]